MSTELKTTVSQSKKLTVKSITQQIEEVDELLVFLLNHKEEFSSLCDKSIHSNVTELIYALRVLKLHGDAVEKIMR